MSGSWAVSRTDSSTHRREAYHEKGSNKSLDPSFEVSCDLIFTIASLTAVIMTPSNWNFRIVAVNNFSQAVIVQEGCRIGASTAASYMLLAMPLCNVHFVATMEAAWTLMSTFELLIVLPRVPPVKCCKA